MNMKPAATEVQACPVETPAIDEVGAPSAEPRKLVGVVPAGAASGRRELFGALEQVFPVRFQGREPCDLDGVDGVLAIKELKRHDDPLQEDGVSQAIGRGCPCLTAYAGHTERVTPTMAVKLAEDEQLARLLRGRRLPEECTPSQFVSSQLDGQKVLAEVDGQPLWWRRAGSSWAHHSVFGPEELASGEALRDRLREGHFMGLLPLLHLLRHLCRDLEWDERPLSAAFVIDDPNLHTGSYGYLNYRELIAHSERHGYHVGMAMVPLDGWVCNRRVADMVRRSPNLSLLMHGNSHLAGELGRLTDDRVAERTLAQAMCRIASAERRSGIEVERVMVPPHELCSTAALGAMFRLGFEGACIGRRHPWRDNDSLSRLTDARLLKWHPTDLMDAGLPIVPRRPIDYSREDLVFAALLRQPLILFAHHWDFANGLDLLEQASNEMNGLGDVRWGSVGSIVRNCFFTKRIEETLYVQMHSRRVVVDVPDGVSVVRVSTSSLIGDEPQRQLVSGAADVRLATIQGGWVSDALPASPGASLELRLASAQPLDPAEVQHPKRTPWPILRRLLVEGRDRARPLFRR